LVEILSIEQKEREEAHCASLDISLDPYHSESSSSSLEGDYLWFELFITVLTRMTYSPADRQELVIFCQQTYAKNPSELAKIVEFEQHYTPDRALYYYTKDICLYRMLNKALRTRDVPTLVTFRSFIADLYGQLKQLKRVAATTSTSSTIVYRGQLLSETGMNWYRACSPGKYLSFSSFVSTSADLNVSKMYLSSQNSVRFEIQIDPSVKVVQPYADISEFSNFASEKEVLFAPGSVFKFEDCYSDG
jgi:hypothetical protein